PGCATPMSDYDRRDYGNCAVLLPWNDDDPDTRDRQDELWQVVRRTFPAKTAEARPLTFPGPVYSAREFKRKLGWLLSELKLRALPCRAGPDRHGRRHRPALGLRPRGRGARRRLRGVVSSPGRHPSLRRRPPLRLAVSGQDRPGAGGTAGVGLRPPRHRLQLG